MSSIVAEESKVMLKQELQALENERRAKVKKAKGAAGKNKAKQKEVRRSKGRLGGGLERSDS
jgi:hypothetical protein